MCCRRAVHTLPDDQGRVRAWELEGTNCLIDEVGELLSG
jgi:hypothetical protein